jgi:hypothetical protein
MAPAHAFDFSGWFYSLSNRSKNSLYVATAAVVAGLGFLAYKICWKTKAQPQAIDKQENTVQPVRLPSPSEQVEAGERLREQVREKERKDKEAKEKQELRAYIDEQNEKERLKEEHQQAIKKAQEWASSIKNEDLRLMHSVAATKIMAGLSHEQEVIAHPVISMNSEEQNEAIIILEQRINELEKQEKAAQLAQGLNRGTHAHRRQGLKHARQRQMGLPKLS